MATAIIGITKMGVGQIGNFRRLPDLVEPYISSTQQLKSMLILEFHKKIHYNFFCISERKTLNGNFIGLEIIFNN